MGLRRARAPMVSHLFLIHTFLRQVGASLGGVDGQVSMGTTLIAARFQGGVVLGADSRSSSGNYVANRFTDKITEVYDSIFMCRSGTAADTQFVADLVATKLEAYETLFNRAPSVRTAATMTRNLCYNNKDRLSAGIICAGWDKKRGGSIYSVPQGGSLHEEAFAVSGSGSTYVLGFCDANLRPDMSREESIECVRQALELAMSRDGGSGGVIHLCVVTAEGVERRVVVPGEPEAGGGGG